jgi:hypothetical protein
MNSKDIARENAVFCLPENPHKFNYAATVAVVTSDHGPFSRRVLTRQSMGITNWSQSKALQRGLNLVFEHGCKNMD